ncbi:spermatogenesis-associated protein 31G1 [Mus musculus]|uniref:Spermatogenesis-associated protein 31G1 n=2 Tax=Mus musculus TaxID=10090 RepID=S31G1_MOUSE|nr:spermatogenesis-associated protein 31G1 [Mus musculus]Q3V0E1.1 RecName: Full=Spermatogenesis-associated protein 31G1 [Mus musculus]EDL02502.1 RIKEN cDNA 1700022I11 [Mus musculus]BAE21563.1 unnamed protein product [Mus musculus]|eukprot:NP_080364.1 uncharacterized protein C9orf131 homolog [Mus musculus]
MGLLQGQLTHALACRHCSSITCLHSPGNLAILVLFMVWQIRRWWQLRGWQQLQPWCSGDKMTQGKGLQLLYHLAFFDCLWKQKSEEEEKEEKECLSLNPLKPYHLSKDTPIGNGFSTAPPHPSCRSEGRPRATETQEQVLIQSPSPSRSFPTFQTLTNLPVRSKRASGSSPQQTKLQLFSGLPSLYNESLKTIFLSSDGPSPLKLSICPSVFLNKVPFPPAYNLLLPCYHSSTYYPTPEAHILEDLEEIAPGSQLVQSPPSPPIPLVSSNLKPLLKGYKRIIPDTEVHTQWFTQNKEVPSVSENQGLYPQPELQKFRSSTFLYSSEVWRKRPGDLRLHQHNPELPFAFLLYPFNPQEVLDRFEMPWRNMKQNEHPKASETAMPTASPLPISLTECQRVNPTGDLSQVKTLCQTTVQKENLQIYELPISAPCQLTVPVTEGTGPPGTPPGYEAQWGILAYKGIPQASDPLMPASCHPSGSLSKVKNVNPKERLSAPKDVRENLGYREHPHVSKSPVSAPSPPLDTLSDYQRENPPEDGSGFKPQWECKETSGSPWASETPTLDFHVGFYEATPMCVPLGSEAQLKGTPSTENLCVYADIVSSPSLPSVSLPDFAIMGPQRILLESKALWETKEQKKHLWTSDSSCPHKTPLAPFIGPKRINTVDDVPRSEATGKNTDNTKKCSSSEPPFLNLNPSPALVQQPLRVSPIENPLKSKAWCGHIQRKNNFLASELPAQSLSQHLLEPSPEGVLSDVEPAGGFMKNKNHCVSASPVWECSPSPNSVLKFHISEPSGDQCNCTPKESVAEWTKDSWANELPGSSFFSALSQEPHSETELVCRNVLEREASQGPNPPAVNPPQPTAWPIQPGLSEAKAEAPSSQGEAVSEVSDHPVIHAWQWSRQLKLRLNKLQQSPTFKSPGSHHSFSSSPVLNLTLESWGPSSCSQQMHPLSLHPCSSSSHPPKVQRAEALPVQAPHCLHSSSQPQAQASGRAEQRSQKSKRLKRKAMVQIPSPGLGHVKADENCSGMGEPSDTGLLVSGKRQDKTLVLLSTQKRGSSRKSKAEKCGRTARLGSPTNTRENNPAQACRPAEASMPRFSRKFEHKAQSSPHSALAQQLLPNAAGPQDRPRTGLVAGETQNPCPFKCCPWIPTKQQLSSLSQEAPPTRGFQKLIDKFLGVHRPLPTKSSP